MKVKNFEKILKPRSIAIVGASHKKGKIGNILIKNLKAEKNKVEIFPINPRHKIIEGLRTYESILDIKDGIDLAIIAIPAFLVLEIVEECIVKKIKNIVIISAGFSESGKDGKQREEELLKLAKENNLNILGPNCLGFLNVSNKINASFAKNEVKAGKIGLVSQSGAFVTGLLELGKQDEIGFSKIITLGNKTVLDEIDFLQYLANDSETEIIGLYLENIKRGRLFLNTVAKISQKKPILILKAGNSEKVQKAILSHTGAMAVEKDVIKKAFEKTGVLGFDDLANFWQTLKVFNDYKKTVNEKMVILTNAGGPGVVATDLIDKDEILDFHKFSQKEKDILKKDLPEASSVENPIDILGDADSQRYKNCLVNLKKIKGIGGVLVLITPQAQTDVENILKEIKENNEKSIFPIIPVLIGEKKPKVFQFPVEAVSSLNQVSQYQKLSQNKKTDYPERYFSVLSNSSKDKKQLEKMKAEKRVVFFYLEAMRLMKEFKIKTLKAIEVDGHWDFPEDSDKVIIKVDDPGVLHKMAQGGVKTGIENQVEFKKELKLMRKKFKQEKIIVQEQVEKGTEIIIGLKKDSSFGTVLLCGLGGILTEIIDEKILWILPITKQEIKRDLKGTKIAKIFEKEGLDLDELTGEIFKVANLGWKKPWLKELDINPMFFYSHKKSLAVDVKVKIDENF
jgi:acetyltransferase